jgi:hypothetical protein
VRPGCPGSIGSTPSATPSRARLGSAALGAGVLAVLLGFTTPFTTGADILTAVAFAAMAAVALRTALRQRTGGRGDVAGNGRARIGRAWLVWAGLFAALEVATYIGGWSGGRHAYPTLSSLLDTATGHVGTKALVALVWLALGWGLFGP